MTKMAASKEGIQTLLLWILLCVTLTTGQEVQLSSSLTLMNSEGESIACVGEQVTFECTGNDLVLMRWIMEPFVSNSNPITFNPTLPEGLCLSALQYNQLMFCLTYKSLSPDNAIADMTTTLEFVAAETIGDVSLDGTIVMCNDESRTIRINKDLPPPVSDLNCTISHTFCDNSTSRVTCTWTPILDRNIISYNFNVTYRTYGQFSPWTVAANESVIEFFLMCSDSANIIAFGVNDYNVAGNSTSIHIQGNCSECTNVYSTGTSAVAITIGTLAAIVVILLVSHSVIGTVVYYRVVITNKKPRAQLQITWKKCKDLPLRMSHMHIVKIGQRLFYGGGYSGTSDTANKLYTCTYNGTELSEWTKLPGKCPVIRFALTHYTVEGKVKLATVGGVEVKRINNQADSGHSTESILTAEVYTYPTESIQNGTEWEIGLHRLNEVRLYPAAVNYEKNNQEYIIACGGIPDVHDLDLNHADYISTDVVEIYDGEKWSSGKNLPMKRNCLSLANVGPNFYVVGGGEAQKITSDAAKLLFHDCNSQWEKMQNCPLGGSTAVEVGERLLAIGGRNTPNWLSQFVLNRKSKAQQSVYVYNDGKWEEVLVNETAHAPAIYMAAAKKLSETEFIMIGGQREKDKPVSSVYIGTISVSKSEKK